MMSRPLPPAPSPKREGEACTTRSFCKVSTLEKMQDFPCSPLTASGRGQGGEAFARYFAPCAFSRSPLAATAQPPLPAAPAASALPLWTESMNEKSSLLIGTRRGGIVMEDKARRFATPGQYHHAVAPNGIKSFVRGGCRPAKNQSRSGRRMGKILRPTAPF